MHQLRTALLAAGWAVHLKLCRHCAPHTCKLARWFLGVCVLARTCDTLDVFWIGPGVSFAARCKLVFT